jgi:tetratricopeptide (TPR) repeat protein
MKPKLLNMKKRFIYIIITFLFVFATGFIILKSKTHRTEKQSVFSEILPRNGALSQESEWRLVKNAADVLTKKINDNPSDIKSLLSLAAYYLQEARITGNLGYYNTAAMKCVDAVLKNEANNFEALTFKAMIFLSQHRFDEGLAIAQHAQRINPYNSFVYGLLVDGNVEKGNYSDALDNADKMVSIRPDNRSYSRIAYLREIHGDFPGAIDAMKMAVDAGSPGEESTEWCRVQLGKLYEQTGKAKEAKMHYTIAVNNRPGYPYALAGLARIAIEERDYVKALSLYQQADSMIPDHSFKESMGEVYTLMGHPDKAKIIAADILVYMKKISGKENAGQNEDHEMAHAYMGTENYEKALEYALLEYKRRPANIEVNETVAIVYYRKGDYKKALSYIETALKTNCKKPELLCHAGLIYAKTGDKAKAKVYLQEALKNHALIAAVLRSECKMVLNSL